jgi:glycosyltransferase involved in cell wall biosynthesis
VSRFLSSCQVGILPSSNDIARRMGTPIKLFSYLEMGLPVVANNVGGWSEIIAHNQVGVVCQDDPLHFAEAILNLIKDNKKMTQFRKNGIELIKEKYNWENSGRTLLNACNRLCA